VKGHSLPVSEVYKYNFVNVRYANGMKGNGASKTNSFGQSAAGWEQDRGGERKGGSGF